MMACERFERNIQLNLEFNEFRLRNNAIELARIEWNKILERH